MMTPDRFPLALGPAACRLALALAAALPAAGAAAAADDPCAGWLEPDFWRAATHATVRACLDAGGDPNTRASGGEGHTPLHLAAEHSNNPRIVWLLLTRGGDPARTLLDGSMPLHLAAQSAGNAAVIVVLAAGGADVDARRDGHDTRYEGTRAIHIAAARADDAGLEIADALIRMGAQLDEYDHPDAWYALHHAAEHAPDARMIELLLEAGHDVNARNDQDQRPLHIAAGFGRSPEAVIALMKGGARRDLADGSGYLPIHVAAASTTVPAVFQLLAQNTDPDDACAPRDDGRTALDHARDNPALADTPAYWALHDICAGRKE